MDSLEELGKHVKRTHKDKFMEELNGSLVLEYEGQRRNFNLIQSHPAYHKAYANAKSTLGGLFYSERNIFSFNSLNFLEQDQMHFLIMDLLKRSGLINSQKKRTKI